MAEQCAQELRDKVQANTGCPADDETVLFIGVAGYVRRRWDILIECIKTAIQSSSLPPDEDVIIDPDWDGRNYYDRPDLKNVRFRLYREGIYLDGTKWRPLNNGGWELLQPGDVLETNQIFSIVRY